MRKGWSDLALLWVYPKLLWRNNVTPGRMVMGLGFYGRSFTMKDPGCLEAGCEFSDSARSGECTGTPGVVDT